MISRSNKYERASGLFNNFQTHILVVILSLVFHSLQKVIQKRFSKSQKNDCISNAEIQSLDLYYDMRGYFSGPFKHQEWGKIKISDIIFTPLSIYHNKTSLLIEKSCLLSFPFKHHFPKEIYLKAKRNEDIPGISAFLNQVGSIPNCFSEPDHKVSNPLSDVFNIYCHEKDIIKDKSFITFTEKLFDFNNYLKNIAQCRNVFGNSRNFTHSFVTHKSPMNVYITNNQVFINLKGWRLFTPILLFRTRKFTNSFEELINQINKLQ